MSLLVEVLDSDLQVESTTTVTSLVGEAAVSLAVAVMGPKGDKGDAGDPGPPGATDHGALTGLADDDHTQYLLASGARVMTGALAMGGNAITGVGNVDGRDVSADGAALDAHVAAANPHSGSLGVAHEGAGGVVHATAVASGAAGFMSGSDKAKLDGIEALADVTDAANVNAAGAVMESDFTATHTILVRQGAATPVAVAVPLSSFVGRIASGDIISMTVAQAKTLLAYAASEVAFTPSGDIAATTVQTAIVEVRDDTDAKLAAKVSVGGQLGGTAASPTVIGARETGGPTLLTYGPIADGELVGRVGTELRGVVGGGSIYDTTSRLFYAP